MKIYDAIVIGAGPAGAAAAYFLARSGKSVLLLEKRTLPRHKSCAGGLPRKTAEIFDFDLSPCLEVAVKGAVFSWLSSDRKYQGGDRVLGWVTRREVFDDFLVRRAVEAGAVLREGTEAIGLIQDRERQADVKGAASTGFAVQGQFPPMQRDQMAGDREP